MHNICCTRLPSPSFTGENWEVLEVRGFLICVFFCRGTCLGRCHRHTFRKEILIHLFYDKWHTKSCRSLFFTTQANEKVLPKTILFTPTAYHTHFLFNPSFRGVAFGKKMKLIVWEKALDLVISKIYSRDSPVFFHSVLSSFEFCEPILSS